eukprot:scaffold44814_cov58-Phaeocystis_antarctica.AAC.5
MMQLSGGSGGDGGGGLGDEGYAVIAMVLTMLHSADHSPANRSDCPAPMVTNCVETVQTPAAWCRRSDPQCSPMNTYRTEDHRSRFRRDRFRARAQSPSTCSHKCRCGQRVGGNARFPRVRAQVARPTVALPVASVGVDSTGILQPACRHRRYGALRLEVDQDRAHQREVVCVQAVGLGRVLVALARDPGDPIIHRGLDGQTAVPRRGDPIQLATDATAQFNRVRTVAARCYACDPRVAGKPYLHPYLARWMSPSSARWQPRVSTGPIHPLQSAHPVLGHANASSGQPPSAGMAMLAVHATSLKKARFTAGLQVVAAALLTRQSMEGGGREGRTEGGGDGDGGEGDGGGGGGGIGQAAVFVAAAAAGLACVPVGIRQRRVGRAPHPRVLGRGIGAANPHFIASRSGDQQRVLLCGLYARQLQARRLAGGVGVGPRKGVAHERAVGLGRVLVALARDPGGPIINRGPDGQTAVPRRGDPIQLATDATAQFSRIRTVAARRYACDPSVAGKPDLHPYLARWKVSLCAGTDFAWPPRSVRVAVQCKMAALRTSRAGACQRVVRPATVGRDGDANRACHITEEGEVIDCRSPGCGASVAHTPTHRRQRVDLHLRQVEDPPSARQLHPDVLRQLWALAEQRANRIRRRSRLSADHPRVCGVDAIGDCVVRQSVLAAIAAVVHGDVGELDRRSEVQGQARVRDP